jgi:endonuclease/exonuclease/phosphatase family metal-dependent hydrolase
VLYSHHFDLRHVQVLDQAKWSDHYPVLVRLRAK